MSYSKLTPNGKVSLSMPQREFVDYLSWIQPIDGAIVLDKDYIHPDRSVVVQLMSLIRYGREDDEVMGLNFSRELCLASLVVNKAPKSQELTKFQEELLKIYGKTCCFPFHIDWPKKIGASLFIQQPDHLKGKPCGMEHYVEVFCLYRGGSNRIHKRSSLRFDVDVIQMHGSAEKSAVWIPPAVSVSRPLLFSSGRIELDVNLDKASVADGEPLVIHVTVMNQSNKIINKLKATLVQTYKLSFSQGSCKVPVNQVETSSDFALAPGGTLNTTMMIVPRVPNAIKKKSIAVRSIVGSKTLALASSTLFASKSEESDFFGFIVSYRVRVKLSVAHQYNPLKTAVVAHMPVYIVASYKHPARQHLQQSRKCYVPLDSSIARYNSFLHREY